MKHSQHHADVFFGNRELVDTLRRTVPRRLLPRTSDPDDIVNTLYLKERERTPRRCVATR
ncbi:MAG: hypothetical protein HC801_13640 [Nitrospira sp.]|nr:hypothetical protein [Nitrospira sp.]